MQEYVLKDREGFFDFARRRTYLFTIGRVSTNILDYHSPVIGEKQFRDYFELSKKIALFVINYIESRDVPITKSNIVDSLSHFVYKPKHVCDYMGLDVREYRLDENIITSLAQNHAYSHLNAAYFYKASIENDNVSNFLNGVFLNTLHMGLNRTLESIPITGEYVYESVRRTLNRTLNAGEFEIGIAMGVSSFLTAAQSLNDTQLANGVTQSVLQCINDTLQANLQSPTEVKTLKGLKQQLRPLRFLRDIEQKYLPEKLSFTDLRRLHVARNHLLQNQAEKSGLGSMRSAPSVF